MTIGARWDIRAYAAQMEMAGAANGKIFVEDGAKLVIDAAFVIASSLPRFLVCRIERIE